MEGDAKGYWTDGNYYGLVDGKYQKFDSEEQYYEIIREENNEEED